jgi:Na+-driven multidrug efflux pump
MLRLMTPGLICAGILMGIGSVFSGSGHTLPFMISSITARWIVQIPLLFLIIKLLHLPMVFIWGAYLIADIIEFGVIYISYKRGTWETKRV